MDSDEDSEYEEENEEESDLVAPSKKKQKKKQATKKAAGKKPRDELRLPHPRKSRIGKSSTKTTSKSAVKKKLKQL